MTAPSKQSPSPYKRILITSLSACPSTAQLDQGAAVAIRDRAAVQVMQIIDEDAVRLDERLPILRNHTD